MSKQTILPVIFGVIAVNCMAEEVTASSSDDIKYCVSISGNYKQLYDEIQEADLLTDKGKLAPNTYILKSKISRFMDLIEKTFCQHGYFDVTATHKITKKSEGCVHIDVNINAGTVYKISTIDIKFDDPKNLYAIDQHSDKIQYKKFITLSINEPATHYLVDEIAQGAQYYFLKRGYPFATVTEKAIDVDRKTHKATVKINVKLGKKLLFGPTTIKGLQSVREDYIRNRIYWARNSWYDIRKVEETVYAISNSQIFSKAEVYVDADNIKDRVAPMIIELAEDKKRAIELGLFYSTVKSYNFQKLSTQKKNLRSFYASICWSHYNLFHYGEVLKLKVFGSPFSLNNRRSSHDYEISVDFTRQDIIIPKDSSTFSMAFARNNQNAYYMLGKSLGGVWTSPFIFPDLKVRFGVKLENNSVNGPFDIHQKYQSCGFPMSITYDKRDSILNPTKGYKIAFNFDPIFISEGRNISRLNIYASQVFRVFQGRKTILAYWASGSKILQRELDAIPLDKRLYAGGIASIRGYGNQMAGPLYKNKNNTYSEYPKGGTSSLEVGTELRRHLYREISGVLFVESAAVGSLKRWYSGYGVGLRYQTVLGPIRLDVAFPVKRRHNIDNRFHFYLSFGQAF